LAYLTVFAALRAPDFDLVARKRLREGARKEGPCHDFRSVDDGCAAYFTPFHSVHERRHYVCVCVCVGGWVGGWVGGRVCVSHCVLVAAGGSMEHQGTHEGVRESQKEREKE
jgi:hypothetical protein